MLRAALLDLDGTLLDTLEDLADSMNEALAGLGLPTHPLDEYRYFVGDGIHVLVERTLPPERRCSELVQQATELYRAAYARNWNRKSRPYDGIPDALEQLRREGVRLTVLSNKPHHFTAQVMAHFFPADWFEVIFGQREAVPRKPDPAGAREIASLLGLRPCDCAFVGDTSTDMATGRAAGMHCLGVTWGFRPESELRETGAHEILHRPSELPGIFCRQAEG